jgi:hypothetical protein
MGDYLVHEGAVVMCDHAGQATPMGTYPRVTLSGQQVSVQPIPYQIQGCTLETNPCFLGQWIVAALRVRAGGMAVVLRNSKAVCVASGGGLNVVYQQFRVQGT